MVLFDEDPVTLIRQTTLNFHTQSDLSSLSRITSSLSTLRSARQLRLQTQTQSLSTLSRKQNHLSRTHADALSAHDASAHANRILALDTQKFRVAKQASELEIEGERLGSDLRSLRGQLEEIERQGVEGDARAMATEADQDQTVLKLKVYRSLGIDAEQDAATGEWNRAVVRNREKGDVRVVHVDVGKRGVDFASHFWGSL